MTETVFLIILWAAFGALVVKYILLGIDFANYVVPASFTIGNNLVLWMVYLAHVLFWLPILVVVAIYSLIVWWKSND